MFCNKNYFFVSICSFNNGLLKATYDGPRFFLIQSLIRYTNADLKICQYLHFQMEILCQRFHIKTPFYFLRQANVRYVKSLFTNIYKFHSQITREFLGLTMQNF